MDVVGQVCSSTSLFDHESSSNHFMLLNSLVDSFDNLADLDTKTAVLINYHSFN